MNSSFLLVPRSEDLYDLVLSLTLLFLIMFSGVHWFTRIPLAALSISAFIWRDLVDQPKFWFLAFCFIAFETGLFWFESDNHKYLTAYWFLSLALISNFPRENRLSYVKKHARLFLVACMGFAVLWKLINGDFMDHSFFEFTLLTDDRFLYFTKYLTGLDHSDLVYNQEALRGILSQSENAVALKKNVRVENLAAFMTYFTLAIETAIPVGFFFFPERVFPHFFLVFFILVTYPVASVIGFAWLLIIFGLSRCDGSRHSHLRSIYCVLFVLTQTFRSDIGSVLDYLFGR